VTVARQTSHFVARALAMWLDDDATDLISNNAFEMMMGTLEDRDILRPVSEEDIPMLAELAMRCVMDDGTLRDMIESICRTLLESTMGDDP
jgi:hypothetical protein